MTLNVQLVLTYFTEPIKNIFILPQKPNKIITEIVLLFFFKTGLIQPDNETASRGQ